MMCNCTAARLPIIIIVLLIELDIEPMSTFTASDGKVFTTRQAWRRYEFELSYTFKGQTGTTLRKEPGQIDGQPFDLADLKECEVILCDHADQVQADCLEGCQVFLGASSESLFTRDCTDCVFYVRRPAL
jgi:protein XRP2